MKRDLFFGRLSTEYVVPPEVHLWRNVVDQVLHDFFKCSSKTTKRDRIEAQRAAGGCERNGHVAPSGQVQP